MRTPRSLSAALIITTLAAATVTMALAAPASAQTYATYHTTTDVSSRSTPTAAGTGVYGAPTGSAIDVQCQINGEPVGPRGNTLYFLVVYAGRTFYVPDTWTDSPHLAGQPPIAGIPMCGATSTPPPAATTPSSDTRIWVGSPFRGQWVPITSDCPGAPVGSSCSLPSVHHFLAPSVAPAGDWSVDLGAAPGTAVKLYAAPQNSAMPVTATVVKIAPTCASGNVLNGGYAVTVAFSSNGTRIGSATYGHIQPSVAQGATVSRWGTTLGTVGSYRNNACWQGSHLHFQLYSEHNYACYNRSWTPGAWMNPTNFLGFTGGNVASRERQACA
jgi:hypothetical protein